MLAYLNGIFWISTNHIISLSLFLSLLYYLRLVTDAINLFYGEKIFLNPMINTEQLSKRPMKDHFYIFSWNMINQTLFLNPNYYQCHLAFPLFQLRSTMPMYNMSLRVVCFFFFLSKFFDLPTWMVYFEYQLIT